MIHKQVYDHCIARVNYEAHGVARKIGHDDECC